MEEGKKNKYNRADGCADIKNMVYNTHLANLEVFYESKEKYKKNLLGLSFHF